MMEHQRMPIEQGFPSRKASVQYHLKMSRLGAAERAEPKPFFQYDTFKSIEVAFEYFAEVTRVQCLCTAGKKQNCCYEVK